MVHWEEAISARRPIAALDDWRSIGAKTSPDRKARLSPIAATASRSSAAICNSVQLALCDLWRRGKTPPTPPWSTAPQRPTWSSPAFVNAVVSDDYIGLGMRSKRPGCGVKNVFNAWQRLISSPTTRAAMQGTVVGSRAKRPTPEYRRGWLF